jgi:transposase
VVTGLKHQKEKRSMDHFAGLDVSVKETSVCIVDDVGKIVREVKVASEPDALVAVLKNLAYHFKRIGLEAGPLSQWLFSALAEAGLPVICVETRHMRAVLKAQINKTDRNDARGMAQMMRVGLYRPVHVKTLRSQKLRTLLTHRQLLLSKAIAFENDLRGTLRNFGLKVGMVGKVKFEARIRELVESLPDLAVLVEPMLIVRRVLREQIVILHRRLLAIVRDDEVCQRLMTTPGVGPVVSLTYRATVDIPASLPQIQVRRGGVWADMRQVSIGRGGLGRQNIALWRCDDADDALRSSPGHDAFQEMVLAQGLGNADRQAPRDEKGDCGAGPPTGCDHAPHLG